MIPALTLRHSRSGLGDELMEENEESDDETAILSQHTSLFHSALAKVRGTEEEAKLVNLLNRLSQSGKLEDEWKPPPPPPMPMGGLFPNSPLPPPPPPPLPPSLRPSLSGGVSSDEGDSGVESRSNSGTFASLLAGKAASLQSPSQLRINSVRLSKPAPSSPASLPSEAHLASLPWMDVPQPGAKLRTFAWHKIAPGKLGQDSLWSKAAEKLKRPGFQGPDFARLESLFRIQAPSTDSPSAHTLERSESVRSFERKKTKETVNLLSRQRSLTVNIFLKQFRNGMEELIDMIKALDGEGIGHEKLRSLAKILPEKDEVETLRAYTGQASELGGGEQFYLALSAIPHYALRVEWLVVREELGPWVETTRGALLAARDAARGLRSSSELHEILTLVLIAGNFLNAGRDGGNAAGFKMSSLWKIVEIRANKPGMTLLHCVAQEAEEKNPKLLQMPLRLAFLEKPSQEPLDGIRSEVKSYRARTTRIASDIKAAGVYFPDMEEFFEKAERDLGLLCDVLSEVEALRVELSGFFCEDRASFRLEEAFKLFHIFAARFAKAVEENAERREREEREALRSAERQKGGSLRGYRSLPRGSVLVDPESGTEVTMRRRSAVIAAASNVRLRHTPDGKEESEDEKGGELMAFLAERRASIDGEGSLDRWRCWGSSIRRVGAGSGGARRQQQRPTILQGNSAWSQRERTVSWRERVAQLLREEDGEAPVERVSSNSDLSGLRDRLPEESAPSPTTVRRSRTERDRRAQSVSELGGGSDLGELLSSLEQDKEAHEVLRKGRRYRWRESTIPEAEPAEYDDVLRHCERSKLQIDAIGRPNDTANAEFDESPSKTEPTTDHSGEASSGSDKESLNQDEGFETESRGSSSLETRMKPESPPEAKPSPTPVQKKPKGVPSYLAPTKAALSRTQSPGEKTTPRRGATQAATTTASSTPGGSRAAGKPRPPPSSRTRPPTSTLSSANSSPATSISRATRPPSSLRGVPPGARGVVKSASGSSPKSMTKCAQPSTKTTAPSKHRVAPASTPTSKRWERLMSPPKRLTQPTSTTATTASTTPSASRSGWRF